MHDMSHEDDNNNKDDDDADDENGGDHVTQQQHTITREHSRIRGDRGRKPREQQTQVNSPNKMRDRDTYLKELVVGHHLIISLTNV